MREQCANRSDGRDLLCQPASYSSACPQGFLIRLFDALGTWQDRATRTSAAGSAGRSDVTGYRPRPGLRSIRGVEVVLAGMNGRTGWSFSRRTRASGGPRTRELRLRASVVRGGWTVGERTIGTSRLGSGRIGRPAWASTMKARQSCAGRPPPVTPFIAASSSLPIQTPATRSALQPTNQASRKFWLVPVLPAIGRPKRAARPVPDSTAATSMSVISAAHEPESTRPAPEPGPGIERPAARVVDRLDPVRPDADRRRWLGGVGRGDLDQADLAGTEGERRRGLHVGA